MEVAIPGYVDSTDLEERLGESGTAIFNKKYVFNNPNQPPAERLYDVAKFVAGAEEKYRKTPEQIALQTRDFYEAMANLEFLPGGRVLSNAGTEIKSLLNCYVLPIEDDLGEIFGMLQKAAKIHKNGGGTGYNFSELRPRGWEVKKGIASGPVSFMGNYDYETRNINSGNRRGANMGILNIDHPDIFEFIRAKDVTDTLTNFNISIGVTDDFMDSYKNGREYALKYNGREITIEDLEKVQKNCSNMKAGSDVGKESIPPSLQVSGNDVYNVYPDLEELTTSWGETIKTLKYGDYDKENKRPIVQKRELVGRIDEEGRVKIDSKKIFELIADYAWKTGDPGLIFVDRLERDNSVKKEGKIIATNPCGEQPLPPYGGCDLGSINLGKVVADGKIDYGKLEKITRTGVRFLDNVNDLNEGPIPEIEENVKNHRRIGLGVMGWADMLVQMKTSYESEQAYGLAEEVMQFIQKTANDESLRLGNEKGVFPSFENSIYDSDNSQQRFRNAARTTIAPTGSISMVAGVNSGIEPFFALTYNKQMRGGDSVLMLNPYFVEAIEEAGLDCKKILEKVKNNKGSCQGIEEIPEKIRNVFKTAMDMDYDTHIEMQSRFQKYVDNAISKTINFKQEATVDDFLNAYVESYDRGNKGITAYRDSSLDVQVLETGEKNGRRTRDKLEELIVERLKEPRPGDVVGRTVKVKTPYDHNAFVTHNFEENRSGKRRPYETFVNIGKSGEDFAALAEGTARLLSMLDKIGVPPELVNAQLIGIGGESQTGIGPQKIKSLPDAIAKAREKILEKESYQSPSLQKKENNKNKKTKEKKHSGNLCPDCGGPLKYEESCQKCSCGYSRC